MITVISNRVPRRVRGVLKIWLLEIKSGVFCGDVTLVIENRIIKFLLNYMKRDSEMIVIRSNKNYQQGFIIYGSGSDDKIICLNGLQLTKESS